MPRASKKRYGANLFRARVIEILKNPDWLDEGVRSWLQKQSRRPTNYIYTDNEHAALARIVAAGTLFEGWDGYNISELLTAACRFKADGDYEDERILDDLGARNPSQLRLREMGHLVAFCKNIAGLPLAPFKPEIANYDDLP